MKQKKMKNKYHVYVDAYAYASKLFGDGEIKRLPIWVNAIVFFSTQSRFMIGAIAFWGFLHSGWNLYVFLIIGSYFLFTYFLESRLKKKYDWKNRMNIIPELTQAIERNSAVNEEKIMDLDAYIDSHVKKLEARYKNYLRQLRDKKTKEKFLELALEPLNEKKEMHQKIIDSNNEKIDFLNNLSLDVPLVDRLRTWKLMSMIRDHCYNYFYNDYSKSFEYRVMKSSVILLPIVNLFYLIYVGNSTSDVMFNSFLLMIFCKIGEKRVENFFFEQYLADEEDMVLDYVDFWSSAPKNQSDKSKINLIKNIEGFKNLRVVNAAKGRKERQIACSELISRERVYAESE